MSTRIPLREFQQALAERMHQARVVTAPDARLDVQTGDLRWLLPVDQVGEILPRPALTPVALTPSWFAGLTNVRGSIISVVDLAAFSAHPGVLSSQHSARLVLLAERLGAQCGLLVEQVHALKRLDALQRLETDPAIAAAADPVPWLVARYCERSRERTGTPGGTAPGWGEIDLIRLCNSERFLRLLPASPQQS